VISVSGVIWGVFETAFFVRDWLQKEEVFRQKIETIETDIKSLVDSQKNVQNYINIKKQSFQVGFRVFKEKDEDTGEIHFRKKFRGFNGKWYELHYDQYYSDMWQVDHYFYVNEAGEQIYVSL
jgi:hypothetical protein